MFTSQSFIFMVFTDDGDSLTLPSAMVVFLKNSVGLSYYAGIWNIQCNDIQHSATFGTSVWRTW